MLRAPQVSTARILDAKRKFAEAALKYYTLSQSASNIDDEDADRLLASAVTCAVLAKVGRERGSLCPGSIVINHTHTHTRAHPFPRFAGRAAALPHPRPAL